VKAESDPNAADYSQPERSCDIVMKGGITSGVVYPLAVCELAQTYRFRNVGGTSAGAIAAAATAAAEYGRGKGGFNELAGLPGWLGEGQNLRDLFQPQPGTRRLFAVLLASVEGGWKKTLWAALGRYPIAAAAGALGPLFLAAIMVAGAISGGPVLMALGAVGLLIGVLLAFLGACLGVIARMAHEATKAVPENGYGLCSGMAGAGSKGPALTEWLHERLGHYADLGGREPLTFGHLWAGPEKTREEAPADPDERWLQLAMMTTNLVNRRAHQLPWESREWFFDPEEFRRLFPEEVVGWMEDHPPPPPAEYAEREVRESRMRQALMRPLLPLPAPADLPVLVATRMSLSFPVLLSAVPLWNLDMTRPRNRCLDEWKRWAWGDGKDWDPLGEDEANWPEEGRPGERPLAEACWFSDGGISSNFPVHFFDRLIPRWPTFAINLRPYAPEVEPDESDETNNTWMVKSNGDGIAEWWYPLPERSEGFFDLRLFKFLSSVMKTMQNRVDEAQMRVPGYRDRVSHVSMSDEEGGMNLTMPEERITALAERGRAAARRLREAYTPPDEPGRSITWDNHRWVRLRSSLSVLEAMHRRFALGFDKEPEKRGAGEATYLELVERKRGSPPKSYPWVNESQRELAKREIEAIKAAATAPNQGETVATEGPEPAPEGRVTPRA
jgi:predicted acylesterase/phospholipase RssA